MGLWSKGLERAQTGKQRREDMTLNQDTILKVEEFLIRFLNRMVSFRTTGDVITWFFPDDKELKYCLTDDCLAGHVSLLRNCIISEMDEKIYDRLSRRLFLNIKKYNITKNENDLLKLH